MWVATDGFRAAGTCLSTACHDRVQRATLLAQPSAHALCYRSMCHRRLRCCCSPCRAADGASEWTRCSDGQSSDWLLLQPYYKAGRIVHRFEHLLSFTHEGKHEPSLPAWGQLAPYPREWTRLVCAPTRSISIDLSPTSLVRGSPSERELSIAAALICA